MTVVGGSSEEGKLEKGETDGASWGEGSTVDSEAADTDGLRRPTPTKVPELGALDDLLSLSDWVLLVWASILLDWWTELLSKSMELLSWRAEGMSMKVDPPENTSSTLSCKD